MSALPVSVVVVSRGRPAELRRCLLGIGQLDYPAFELVVVADAGGCDAVQTAGLTETVKLIPFDRANISQARNLGIAAAAGDVVAFLDDDAVPEPSWLRHLTAPFGWAPEIDAAGGFVRGRNGITFQHRASLADRLGRRVKIELPTDASQEVEPPEGHAVKTEGTNCAFRRKRLVALGGFDPGFAFYMDETDVNLRLAAAGARTAIVPCAEVHHGFAASERRHRSRLPTNLWHVGAGSARILRKHGRDATPGKVFHELKREQRLRLERHMVAGNCEPRDVARLLATLRAGWEAGLQAPIHREVPDFTRQPPEFRAFKGRRFAGDAQVLAGRVWSAAGLRRKAAAAVEAGHRTSLFLFSRTALYHHVRFTASGVWEQTGGLFGRSDRTDPLVRPWSMAARVARETARVGHARNTGPGIETAREN